jgi:hypothetical protein
MNATASAPAGFEGCNGCQTATAGAPAWPGTVQPAAQSAAARLPVRDQKQLATAKARCALWGGVVHELEGDSGQPLLIVTRWSLTRSFEGRDALDDIERFLDLVGAPK